MSVIEGLNWVVTRLLPAFFSKFDSWMITYDVSVLGFSAAVMVLTIVIGAILLRV